MELLEPYQEETNTEGGISNQNTNYLICHVGTPLTKALCEIVKKKPLDPIEYLSGWLYKYKENELVRKREDELLQMSIEAEIKRIEKLACIAEERRLVNERRKQLLEIRRQEKLRIEEEKMKRREMEKLRLRHIHTPEKKDINGQTPLHILAAVPDADFTQLDYMPLLLVERDKDFRTPRDVAKFMGHVSNVTEIDKYVLSLLEKGDIIVLKYLLMSSYEHFQQALELRNRYKRFPETTHAFLSSLKIMQEKIGNIFLLVQERDNELTDKWLEMQPLLATCKNARGHSLLHIAVIAENIPIVKRILEINPHAANITDNLSRTPLHFAYALSGATSEILLENKALDNHEDFMERIPIYYKENPGEIKKIRGYYIRL